MDEETPPPDGTFAQLMDQESSSIDNSKNEGANVGTNESTNVGNNERRKERTNTSTDEHKNERADDATPYSIDVPQERAKVRASFDIFKDQKVALDKIQLAMVDAGSDRPKLGEMVQEAIDVYIRKMGKELPNVSLKRQRKRTDER